jgi:outer membrane protein OmpA-like peptidoglycan-associated protein
MTVTPEKIEELKKLVEELKLSKVFEELDNLKISDLRLTKLRNDFVLGKTDSDYFERFFAFLDDLKNKEFETHKRGHILYSIPQTMQLEKKIKCIVRISICLDAIIKGLNENENNKIEKIRIAKSMEVVLENDLNEAFEIEAKSSKEQFIDFYEDEFTQWVFFVKPILAGEHTIVLKVSVIEVVNNQSKKKEIVLEKNISVKAEDVIVSLDTYETVESVVVLPKNQSISFSKQISYFFKYTTAFVVVLCVIVNGVYLLFLRHKPINEGLDNSQLNIPEDNKPKYIDNKPTYIDNKPKYIDDKTLDLMYDKLASDKTILPYLVKEGNTLKITFTNSFKSGSSLANWDRKENIETVVGLLKGFTNYDITIEGHTDDIGSDQLNYNLSRNRANFVKIFLVQEGLKSNKISVVPFGEEKPITSNSTEEGREQNRRIVIIVRAE